jgi:hypothetical protein
MHANVILPLLSSGISFIFAALVMAQWKRKRRAFQHVWAIGLIWYGVSSGTEFLGSAIGWTEGLYRTWYLIGAFFVAAWLGMGTMYLLAKTRFGYFVAFAIFVGGLFSPLSQLAAIRDGKPAPWWVVFTVIGVCTVAALVIAVLTARARPWAAHFTLALLVAASLLVTVLVFTAHVDAPGYALAPTTGAPVGTAMPGYLRVQTGPFNIAGAFTLVFGAIYSFFIYMPKRKVMPMRLRVPVIGLLYGVVAVAVNLIASLPGAVADLFRGKLRSRVPATLLIALGGFVPSITSGLNRFGITWAFFLGELIGVVCIFAGFLVSEEVFASVSLRLGRLTLVRRDDAEPAVRVAS